VSKIHFILIFMIFASVGTSVYLLMDGDSQKPTKTKVLKKKSSNSNSVKTGNYVQGVLKVPDLAKDFKRCLGRGYSPIELEVLREARDIFDDHVFDEGSFSWNKVTYIDELGEKVKLFLGQDLKLSISKELEGGEFKEIEKVQLDSLEELKERLEGKQVLINEYSQVFVKGEVKMELLLSGGMMKFLKVQSPKKKVICKP